MLEAALVNKSIECKKAIKERNKYKKFYKTLRRKIEEYNKSIQNEYEKLNQSNISYPNSFEERKPNKNISEKISFSASLSSSSSHDNQQKCHENIKTDLRKESFVKVTLEKTTNSSNSNNQKLIQETKNTSFNNNCNPLKDDVKNSTSDISKNNDGNNTNSLFDFEEKKTSDTNINIDKIKSENDFDEEGYNLSFNSESFSK